MKRGKNFFKKNPKKMSTEQRMHCAKGAGLGLPQIHMDSGFLLGAGLEGEQSSIL